MVLAVDGGFYELREDVVAVLAVHLVLNIYHSYIYHFILGWLSRESF